MRGAGGGYSSSGLRSRSTTTSVHGTAGAACTVSLARTAARKCNICKHQTPRRRDAAPRVSGSRRSRHTHAGARRTHASRSSRRLSTQPSLFRSRLAGLLPPSWPHIVSGGGNRTASSRACLHLTIARRKLPISPVDIASPALSMSPIRSSGQMRTTGLATMRLSARGPQTRESTDRASQSPSTKSEPSPITRETPICVGSTVRSSPKTRRRVRTAASSAAPSACAHAQ